MSIQTQQNVIYVTSKVPPPIGPEIVIDATNHIAGRLASIAALWALQGFRIVIVNAEKAVITGDFNMILNWYKKKITEWRTHYNPEKVGPKIPRKPDRILRRIIRGMLPRKQWRGRKAFKRIRVYLGTPPEYLDKPKVVIVGALLRPRPGYKYITLEELWKHLEPHRYEMWKKGYEAWMKYLQKIREAKAKEREVKQEQKTQ